MLANNLTKRTNNITLMKQVFYAISILFIFGCSKKTDQQIFTAISQKLQELDQIQYDFTYERKSLKTPSESFSHSGTLAIDFTKENNLGANAYSTRTKKGEKVFERLTINDTLIDILDNTKTIVKTPNAHPIILDGNIDLYFNIADIRKSLPLVIKDSTITNLKVTDTIFSETPSISVTFNIKKFILGGNLYDSKEVDNFYQLVVRKEDYIPLAWKLKNENTIDLFSCGNIQFNINSALWDYAKNKDYITISGKEYRLRQKNDLNKQLGKSFPDWNLSTIRGKKLSNKDFKNKVTLYEFFFVGCAGSIHSKPFLETLNKKYGKSLDIINIEIHNNSQKSVRSFVEEYKLKEPAVLGGKSLADQLGVLGCPTYILVNKSGEIIFTSFGDKAGLEERIQQEL